MDMTDKKPISREEKKSNHSEFHFMEPDYDREIFQIPPESKQKILDKLAFLYGESVSNACYGELERIMRVYYAYKTPRMIQMEESFNPHERFTEKDVILITYGDLIQAKDEKPLQILADFTKYLKKAINTLHILPFFPYSSDRGFSVTDFEEVDSRLGTWEDILELKSSVKLMFDGVFNHISSKSRWFQEFLDGNPRFQEAFIVFSTKTAIPEEYLSLILRPRTSELLSTFSTLNGKRSVWTTFSRDQVDLNFKNPEVLLKMAQILLLYVRRGADLIRLDAVTYLWHELGTSCAHLEQTHTVIKLFRDILDAVAPHVALVSETNVPHEDNIQYFGKGHDEAQMVYNFALPPLVLHTFQTGSSAALTKWAMGLHRVSNSATYFNILDSHDGIGVLGAKNILTDEEIEMMALRVVEHGGFISFKDNGDGTASPYELNTTWYSALNREDCDETLDFKIKRFLASRAIALVLMGIPGIYLHGLFGSKNDADAVLDEGQTRSISRRSFDRDSLYETLDDPDTSTHKIAYGFGTMVWRRTLEKAFHPNAAQHILNISDAVFAVLRTSVDQKERILCVINITSREQHITVDLSQLELHSKSWLDILSEQSFAAQGNTLTLKLSPYDVVWLKTGNEG
ncbi:alpha amylase, catalytic domain protein [delta proteobacterium NaphS2]|nr:alpha amylase, catalytic domain protein [delta proteobacterium NaphS2]